MLLFFSATTVMDKTNALRPHGKTQTENGGREVMVRWGGIGKGRVNIA